MLWSQSSSEADPLNLELGKSEASSRWAVSPASQDAPSASEIGGAEASGPAVKEIEPDQPVISGFRRQTHQTHRVFAGIVAWLGSIAIAGVATLLFIVIVRLIGALIEWRQGSAIGPMLVLGSASTIAIGIFWTGYANRTLGIRRRDRLPQRVRRFLAVSSMADELKMLRTVLVVLAVLPFVATSLDSLVRRVDYSLPVIGPASALLFGWAAMMLSGLTILICGVSTFREVRSRFLRNSLRFHHRGVALRSFISAWDNPGRKIYLSCRLSRMVSRAHTTILISSLACFSFAGCLAALIHTDFYGGEMLTLGSIVAIGATWPTPSRLVAWSAQVLDQFCSDPEEYETY